MTNGLVDWRWMAVAPRAGSGRGGRSVFSRVGAAMFVDRGAAVQLPANPVCASGDLVLPRRRVRVKPLTPPELACACSNARPPGYCWVPSAKRCLSFLGIFLPCRGRRVEGCSKVRIRTLERRRYRHALCVGRSPSSGWEQDFIGVPVARRVGPTGKGVMLGDRWRFPSALAFAGQGDHPLAELSGHRRRGSRSPILPAALRSRYAGEIQVASHGANVMESSRQAGRFHC